MEDGPHLSESEWTRLWAHTLTLEERRRITAAVKSDELLHDPRDAVLAAELARRMRAGRRPAAWLVWGNAGLGLLVAALLIYRWPEVRWLDLLLLALPLLNLANIVISRRAHPGAARLLKYEQESLQRSRDVPQTP